MPFEPSNKLSSENPHISNPYKPPETPYSPGIFQIIKYLYDPTKTRCLPSSLLEKTVTRIVKENPLLFPEIKDNSPEGIQKEFERTLNYLVANSFVYKVSAGILYFGPYIVRYPLTKTEINPEAIKSINTITKSIFEKLQNNH